MRRWVVLELDTGFLVEEQIETTHPQAGKMWTNKQVTCAEKIEGVCALLTKRDEEAKHRDNVINMVQTAAGE